MPTRGHTLVSLSKFTFRADARSHPHHGVHQIYVVNNGDGYPPLALASAASMPRSGHGRTDGCRSNAGSRSGSTATGLVNASCVSLIIATNDSGAGQPACASQPRSSSAQAGSKHSPASFLRSGRARHATCLRHRSSQPGASAHSYRVPHLR